jgi:hypothetical protein
VLIKTPISLLMTILVSQELLVLGCGYTPTEALAFSASTALLANTVVQGTMRHLERKDRAQFLSTASLRS